MNTTPTRTETELDTIRQQLIALEYLDAQTAQMRRALQDRRAQLLEQQEDSYAVS
jgi:hypothetical protein